MVKVEGLAVRFGELELLRDLDFEVTAGTTVCILGASGGGKSTLLKTMTAIHRPASGRVLIEGKDIHCMSRKALESMRRRIGVMFQGGALLNSMTVAENVALPIQYHTQLDPETIATIVKIKLHMVGLLEAADLRPGKISGGMVKRAAIARAIALDPRILFYDEPTSGLDPVATSRIDELMNELKDGFGMTSIVVTHSLESAQRIADRVIMLHRGRIIYNGSFERMMQSEDSRIRQFLTGDLGGATIGATTDRDYLRDLLA